MWRLHDPSNSTVLVLGSFQLRERMKPSLPFCGNEKDASWGMRPFSERHITATENTFIQIKICIL